MWRHGGSRERQRHLHRHCRRRYSSWGYAITPNVGTLSATNYDFPDPRPGQYFVNGTLTIGYGTCSGPNPSGVILQPINADGSSIFPRAAALFR